MKTSSKFISVLLGTIATMPAQASMINPTLETLKTKAADLTGLYLLTESTGNLPLNASEVTIEGKKYYFVPSGDNALLLKILAGSSAGNLTESANGIFELDNTKYGFDISALPSSVFEYSEATAENYDFIIQEADAEGNLTDKYYKIVLKPQNFSLSENITWSETDTTTGSGLIDDDLSDGTIKGSVAFGNASDKLSYYEYTYNKPDNYTISENRLKGDFSSADVTGVVFKGISASSSGDTFPSGGAIYNTQNTNLNIVADFIGNYSSVFSGADGGGIYNNGSIDSIMGAFIENYVSYSSAYARGGAIYNNGSISLINGDFVSNHAFGDYAYGGALYNTQSITAINADFIGNYATPASDTAHASGGAIYNYGNKVGDEVIIGSITGNFVGNYVAAGVSEGTSSANGGAIYNTGLYSDNATIGNITGNFIENHAEGTFGAYGGAISNDKTMGNVTGDFMGNYAVQIFESYQAWGGAIYNNEAAVMGNITGNFINNYTSPNGLSDYVETAGGAIANQGTLGDITGNFIDNYTTDLGGAIINFSNASIGQISGDFVGNRASGGDISRGGAIYNGSGEIKAITGKFVGNYSQGSYSVSGGAIYNVSGDIGDINADFITNYVQGGSSTAYGGAVYNKGNINSITGDFIGNYTFSDPSVRNVKAYGGAIYNSKDLTVSGNFINNYAKNLGDSSLAAGGAVYTSSDMTFISGNDTKQISGNYTYDPTHGKNYNAIFVEGSGTETDAPVVTFDTTGGGAWIINDSISGGYITIAPSVLNHDYYNLAFSGNDTLNGDGLTTQYIAINNDIINASEISVSNTTLRFGSYNHNDNEAKNSDGHGRLVANLQSDGTVDLAVEPVTSLVLNNAAFDLYNDYQDEVNLTKWQSNGSYLHIDVDVNAMTADMLNIYGNVEGVTKLVVYPNAVKDITGESIVFAQSWNDNTGVLGSFEVYRVYRSPYMYEVGMDSAGETEHTWYLTMTDEVNDYAGVNPGEHPDPEDPDIGEPDPEDPDIGEPDPENPDIGESDNEEPGSSDPDTNTPGSGRPIRPGTVTVVPEVIASQSLPSVAIAQTTNMIYNIMNKVSSSRLFCRGCGFYDYYWDGKPFRNLWVNPIYTTVNIKSPTDIEADIWGIEAGGDIQQDINNRLGVFVSYRNGQYDMNGDGDKYYSTIGSEIDVDSYLAGLYYRYDKNNKWVFATLYGGIQKADINTDDGVKSDTDGVEFGGSIEVGYDYALTDSFYVTPSIGAFYTQVTYDDATDNMGKRTTYNDIRQVELEAGIKLNKTLITDENYANIYIKPSVVQTIVDGDEVNITGLGDVDTIDDATLGRVEIGGRYGFSANLSVYGWANYTFGSDYDASTFGVGLNYTF